LFRRGRYQCPHSLDRGRVSFQKIPHHMAIQSGPRECQERLRPRINRLCSHEKHSRPAWIWPNFSETLANIFSATLPPLAPRLICLNFSASSPLRAIGIGHRRSSIPNSFWRARSVSTGICENALSTVKISTRCKASRGNTIPRPTLRNVKCHAFPKKSLPVGATDRLDPSFSVRMLSGSRWPTPTCALPPQTDERLQKTC
jgi:hypothetical protein